VAITTTSNLNLNFNSNQPSLKDLVLGQDKSNESLTKKLAANDKTLESINIKNETVSFALKNHLSFNKMIETQLDQIATVVPAVDSGKILGNLKLPLKMLAWWPPDGVTHPGGHPALTM
jgi:hypothetical protein